MIASERAAARIRALTDPTHADYKRIIDEEYAADSRNAYEWVGPDASEQECKPEHVHDYRQVPDSERDDRMKFVCALYKCRTCPAWYWL